MSRVLKTGQNQITQHYGNNGHTGVDLVKYSGQTDMIIAHSAGKVVFCQKGQSHNPGSTGNASYGNCIKIKHDNGYYTLYAHLADVRVSLGQYVKQGQDLGYMRKHTETVIGNHLHFEVFNANNQRINPEPYLDADLPGSSTGYTGTITYQAYTNRWLPEVNKCDNTTDGYAGDSTHFISGVRAKPQFGEIKTKSHILNGDWLDEISSKDYVANDTLNGNTYSGIYNTPLDAIMFTTTKGYIDARVKTSRGWLPWVRFYKTFNEKIYVGNFGELIIGIQMK